MQNVLPASGRTADVYDWEDGYVLKLFRNWFELEEIEYELKIARAVHASGAKAPAVGKLIQVLGQNDLIYERVDGESMLAMLQRKPWMVFAYSRILAQLHTQMHECVFDPEFPGQRTRLQNKINQANALPVSLKTSLLNRLQSLPDGNRLCHGDFHPANILLSDKNSTVIDWIDASRGNPLADVARTTIIFLGAAETTQIPSLFIKMLVKLSHAVYVREYFRLRPGGEKEYLRWLPIVAGARLSEEISELEEWLTEQVKKLK